jgi:predicted DNA-binding transcriptional regulator AlpA
VPSVDTPTISSGDELPLLTPVPRAARMLGISRATAYRLAATGEPPSRRLGGRVYVITSAIRALGRHT